MAPRPVKVTITYCSECGYEPQTLALADALMREFRHELSAIELIPWYDGSFDVSVNGERVHPAEAVFDQQVRESGWARPPIIEELKAEARSRGLIQGCYLMPSYGRYDLVGELAAELLR